MATPHLYNGRQAPHPLHILIVGCGLGGLSAAHCLSQSGHTITLLESASSLGEVGAGIQVSPNVSRLLIRWGLGKELEAKAVRPEAIVLRRYRDGEIVGYSRWGEEMSRVHGAPYFHVHRADFHRMVYDLTRSSNNVTIKLNSTVVDVNPTPSSTGTVSVTLSTGEEITGDLIIGADGLKSRIRQTVLGKPDAPKPTGDAAYRAIIPTSVMLADPELRPFVDLPEMTGWMGPGRHLMGYCIRAKKEYNLVMLHPDTGSIESWTAQGSGDKMRADFADFEPRVRKLLSHVQTTLKWRLMDREPLETWVHEGGRVVLLGDACHPMLPYRAQGAAMALEDASLLSSLLTHISHPLQIPFFLKAYESLRIERATKTQESSRLNQRVFHLADGEEQRERDASMRRGMWGEGGWRERLERERSNGRSVDGDGIISDDGDGKDDTHAGNANQWSDKQKNIDQFSYDADAVAELWWDTHGKVAVEEFMAGIGA